MPEDKKKEEACMRSDKRIFRTLLCLVVLLAMAFSAFFIVAESGHDCTGGHCAICHQLELCNNLLHSLALAVSVAGLIAIDKFMCRFRRTKHSGRIMPPTLVALRVKLSD